MTEGDETEERFKEKARYSFYKQTFKKNKALIFFYFFTILTLILCTINYLRFW